MDAYGNLIIKPIPALTPVQVAALSDSVRSQREVDTARNEIIRQAGIAGHQIPAESRATKYKSPVLQICEAANKTAEWKAAALAELERTEANKAREKHRTKRAHNRRVETKVAKRKTRAAKKKRGIPSPPHRRGHPHSSDEAAETAEEAVRLGGLTGEDE